MADAKQRYFEVDVVVGAEVRAVAPPLFAAMTSRQL
jgi:hypothetical protein